jgi:hypothetical protein
MVFVYKTLDDMMGRISDDLGYIWVLSEPLHGRQRVGTTDRVTRVYRLSLDFPNWKWKVAQNLPTKLHLR